MADSRKTDEPVPDRKPVQVREILDVFLVLDATVKAV
jgi:hypothetical protein